MPWSGTSTINALVKAAAEVGEREDLAVLLRKTVELARDATASRYAAMGVIGAHQTLRDFIYVGLTAEDAERIGHFPVGHGVLGTLIRHPETVRVDDISKHPDSIGFPPHHPHMKTFLGVPVRAAGAVFGNLYLTEKAIPYDDEDVVLVEALSAVAGTAISSLDMKERLARLAVAEDRERIARDLHDAVIQDLFAVGLSLQATSMHLEDDAARRRMDEAVDRIDDAIASLRTFIFDLRSLGTLQTSMAQTLESMVGRIAGARGSRWDIQVAPDIGETDSRVLDNALLVVREAVSNAVRHGGSGMISVSLSRRGSGAELVVTDDGGGFDPENAKLGMGIKNMRARAEDHGGELAIESSPDGTTVRASLRPPRS